MHVIFERGSGKIARTVKGPFKEVRFSWGGELGVFVDGGQRIATFDQRTGAGVYVIDGEPFSTAALGEYFEIARVVDRP